MRLSGLIIRPLLGLLLCSAACVGSVQAQGPVFAQPTVIPTGNWPVAVYAVDMNHDGSPDLVYIEAGATPTTSFTHVLLNDGHGNFKESAVLATAGDSVAIGDLTAGGRMDIGWLTWTQTTTTNGAIHGTNRLSIAPARGDGTFATTQVATFDATPVRNPTEYHFLVAARFHFGGGLDVVAEDPANNLIFTYRRSLGGSSSVDATQANLPDGAGPITIADLNGDPFLDLLVTSVSTATVQVYLNPITYTSQNFGFGQHVDPVSRFKGTSGVHSVLVQDVNQDGRADLIAEGANGRIDVFPGNGDGTFSSTSIGGTGTLDGLTGNGGHLIGLSVLPAQQQAVAFTATAAGISSLIGQGNAYFGLKGIYNAGPGRAAYALADFNGDGILDLAVDSPEGIAILYGNADGSFQTSQAFAAGQPALSSDVAAFTPSGNLDVVVSTAATQGQVLLGQGDGTFLAAPAPTTPQTGAAGLWSRVQAGNLSGRGFQDLVFTADGANAALPANGSGIAVQLGNGDGTFSAPTAPAVANQFSQPAPSSCQPPFDHFPGLLYGTSAVADFNADGLLDIANRDSGAYRILRGNDDTFAGSSTYYPTLFWSGSDGTYTASDCNLNAHQQVASGDLNGDGRPDAIFQSNGSLLVYETDKTGQLGPVGDLAVDGSLTTPGQTTAPDLSPQFGGVSQALGYPAAIGSMLVADLDGDGNQDVLVLYHNLAADPAHPATQARNWLYVWYGSGGGRFLTSAAHPVNPVRVQPTRDFYQMAVGRLDSSGKPLIAMSDGYVLSIGELGAEQHYLAGQGINSISVADLRKSGQGDLVIANGGLTLSNPVANHELLTPNPNTNTGGITVLLNASPRATALTGTLAASPEPSTTTGSYSLTLTLTPPAGSPVPTGTVQFSLNGTALGAAATLVANGSGGATATVSDGAARGAGTYTVSAVYSGDTNYPAPPAFTGSHAVVLTPTATTLTPTTPLTVYYGQGIDGHFAVTYSDPSGFTAAVPDGTYTLEDNGMDVSICTALPITTECPYGNPALLDAGPHSFQVHYLGTAVYAPSISPALLYTVLPDLTAVSLTAAPTSATQGDPVVLSAAVTGNVVNPASGTVTFLDGSTVIGTGQLDSTGRASLTTTTLSLGDHTITVSYPGSLDFNPALSKPVLVHINVRAIAVASAVSLRSSLNPAAPGQRVTMTANVTVPGPFAYVPTGTVTFTVDGQTIAAPIATDQYGIARVDLPALAPGSHPVVASYSGAPGAGNAVHPPGTGGTASNNQPPILPSTSNTVTEIITNPLVAAADGFLLNVTPDSGSVVTGRLVFFVVTVTPQSGFAQTVKLSCSGLPTEAACMFLPALVPAGGGAVPLQISTASPHDCGDPGHPYSLSGNGGGPLSHALPLTAFAGVFGLLFLRRRRTGLKLLAFVVMSAALYAASGCGRCTDLGTRPGTYTITVTGTAQGGPVTETVSQQIQVVVTLQ